MLKFELSASTLAECVAVAGVSHGDRAGAGRGASPADRR